MKSPLGFLRNRVPVPFVGRQSYSSGNAWWSRSDKTSQIDAYGATSTLFQIVHSLAEDTSRVEWHMHRIRQRGSSTSSCSECDQNGVELIPSGMHQALKVWSRPNDFFTGQEFVEGFQQHIDLTGEGYWIIESMEGLNFPTGMWYVRPDRMKPVPDPNKFLLGWMYCSPDGQEIALTLDQVCQLKMPSPSDPYRGMGPVQSMMRDIGASNASAAWTENFFENSARPGGVIEVPTSLDDNEFKRLSMQWNEQHKGVMNAHRVAILESGLTWKDMSYSPKDMILTDLRKFSSDQIRQGFGFPEFASGILENANRASSEAAAAWYTQRLIVPRLDRIKDVLNYKFLALFGPTGQNVEFAYVNPIPEDAEAENAERASKTTAYKTLVDAGVDPEDAALVVGLPVMRNNRALIPAVPGAQNE